MGVHVYFVEEDICEVIFSCYLHDGWTERLLRLDKFDNGMWMEFTNKELAEMEAEANLTRYEQEIVWSLQLMIEANGGESIRLEFF